jgi:hypothetical protein
MQHWHLAQNTCVRMYVYVCVCVCVCVYMYIILQLKRQNISTDTSRRESTMAETILKDQHQHHFSLEKLQHTATVSLCVVGRCVNGTTTLKQSGSFL